jgi:hypothetical protein
MGGRLSRYMPLVGFSKKTLFKKTKKTHAYFQGISGLQNRRVSGCPFSTRTDASASGGDYRP